MPDLSGGGLLGLPPKVHEVVTRMVKGQLTVSCICLRSRPGGGRLRGDRDGVLRMGRRDVYPPFLWLRVGDPEALRAAFNNPDNHAAPFEESHRLLPGRRLAGS